MFFADNVRQMVTPSAAVQQLTSLVDCSVEKVRALRCSGGQRQWQYATGSAQNRGLITGCAISSIRHAVDSDILIQVTTWHGSHLVPQPTRDCKASALGRQRWTKNDGCQLSASLLSPEIVRSQC